MLHGKISGQLHGPEFGKWVDCATDVTAGNGMVVLETYDGEKSRSRMMLTAEEAGRMALSLLAAAREGGWKP
jgi:hypothetical protein